MHFNWRPVSFGLIEFIMITESLNTDITVRVNREYLWGRHSTFKGVTFDRNSFLVHPTKAYLERCKAYIFSLKKSMSRKPYA